jgi:hypothetical protein
MPVILATQEAEIGRIMVQGQPRQKSCETPFPRLGVVACVCHPSYLESVNGRILIQASLGINSRLYLKQKKKKRTGSTPG